MLSYNRATFAGLAVKKEDEVLVPLLYAVEESEAPATHWGETIELRNAYDRSSVLAHSQALYGSDESGTPCVRRTKPPRYTITWTTSLSESWSVKAVLHPTSDSHDFEQFAHLVESITKAIAFDFAVVDYINDATNESFLPGIGVHSGHLRKYGITTVTPWTYFGPRIIAMTPGDAFATSLGTGVGWLKLSPAPWHETHAVLLDRVQLANQGLDLLGLRARVADPGYAVPGTGWQPLVSLV